MVIHVGTDCIVVNPITCTILSNIVEIRISKKFSVCIYIYHDHVYPLGSIRCNQYLHVSPFNVRISRLSDLTTQHALLPPKIVGTFYMKGYKVKEKRAIVPHYTPSFKTQWAPWNNRASCQSIFCLYLHLSWPRLPFRFYDSIYLCAISINFRRHISNLTTMVYSPILLYHGLYVSTYACDISINFRCHTQYVPRYNTSTNGHNIQNVIYLLCCIWRIAACKCC
jgi:hypothetical protein